MNSYERVMNRFEGKEVDRLPNLSIVMMFAAKQIGVSYGEFISDYRKFTEANLYCCEKFGFDILSAISDSLREAEGFGANVIIYDDRSPECEVLPVQSIGDISRLKVFDPYSSARCCDRIQAVSLMKEKAAGQLPVMGWIEGAFAQGCDLMNMEELFISLFEESDAIKELMEKCTEVEIAFAKAQIEAGAEIMGIGDSAASLIGPALYEEFALPYLKRIIDFVHNMGVKVKLHICGDITKILPLVHASGADMIDLDYMVDMNEAAKLIPRNVCLCGNFDPVEVLLQGTPELINKEVHRCMKLNSENNNCISPGCEIPPDTDPANVLAIQEAICEGI